MSAFKITITRVEEKTVTRRGEHKLLEKRPWTQAELSDERGYAFREDRSKFLDGTPLKEIYGYAPSFEATETVEVKLLEQTVEAIDLAAVIKAINNL
jgi:hypothetical protein